MNDVKKYLETKELRLSKNMNGYEITYSYLCAMLDEFAKQQVKKLTIDDVSKRDLLNEILTKMQDTDDDRHFGIVNNYLNGC